MASISVLHVSTKGAVAAKTIKLSDTGEVQKINFCAGKWFHYSTVEIDGIAQLSAYLTQAALDKHSLLVRGVLAKNKEPTALVRRLGVKAHGEDGYFVSHPTGQPWLLLDFDGIPTPGAINFINQPKDAIAYLVSQLPSYFSGVSYHYHLSSSAGLDDGKSIRAHVWYWLDEPVNDDALRTWAKSINSHGNLIDTALFNAVHPHYTADPVFDGVPDPFLGKRSGFLKGKSDAVALPKVLPASTSIGSTVGLSPSDAFTKYLNAVGDQIGGMGFHEPLMMAAWSYVLDQGPQATDKTALHNSLKQTVLEADSSKHPDKSYIATKASDAYLNCLIEGAIAKIGAKGKTGKVKGIEPYHQLEDILTPEAAQERLSEIVASYFESPRNVGIRAGAGLGKTTEVIAKLSNIWVHDKRLEYYVPTHKLGEEIAGKLKYHPFKEPHFSFQKGAPTGLLCQVIIGRGQATKQGKPYCLKNDIATLLVDRGYSVYPTLCQSGEQCCEHFGECEYIRQFNGEYDIRVFPHAYLALERGYLDGDLPDYAVIDESFYNTLIAGIGPAAKPISFNELKLSGIPSTLAQTLAFTPQNTPLLSYLRSKVPEDELCDMIGEALFNLSGWEPPKLLGLETKQQLSVVKEAKVAPRIQTMLAILHQELLTGRDIAHGVVVTDNGWQLRYRKPITRFSGEMNGVAKKVSVLTIDADLTPAVHGEFFPDTEYHRINTERNCNVVQCFSTQNSKTSLTIDGGASKRIEEIQTLINRIAANRSLLVVGPLKITGNEDKAPALVAVPEGSALAHFNALRGIDKYKDMDAILIISRNQPAMNDAEALACALWFDSDEPLKLGVTEAEYEPRGYRTRSGYAAGVNVAIHPDPRVQTIIELIREAETLQCIDRLRLVHIVEPKQVILLSNLVLDLTVDNLLSWGEVVEGTTKLNEVWKKTEGVIPLSDKWLSATFPDLFPSAGSAKGYLKSVGEELGQLSNGIIIRELTQLSIFSYAISGQSGPALRCLTKYDLEETKNRLATLIGKAVSVKSI